MAQKFNFRPSKLDTSSKNIYPSTINDGYISFSFKRLNSKPNKFKYENMDSTYFIKFIERLKCVCVMTKKEILTSPNKTLRCHKINFKKDKVSENSFGIKESGADENAYQISISANEHGRIHGYFIDDVFYIVWCDPEHELYK